MMRLKNTLGTDAALDFLIKLPLTNQFLIISTNVITNI